MPPQHSLRSGRDATQKEKQSFETMVHRPHPTRDYEFNLREEMEEYCISDVKLLKAGCQKFQSEFHKQVGFKPLEKCLTIASACHRYWRKKLLKRKMIAAEPVQGWQVVLRTNQSYKALQWLAWHGTQSPSTPPTTTPQKKCLEGEERMAAAYPDTPVPGITGDFIRHAHNGGEVRIAGCLVDWIRPKHQHRLRVSWLPVARVYAMFFRSPAQTSNVNPDRTFAELREATTTKEEKIVAAGYSLVVMWECEWERMVKTDPQLQTFLADLQLVTPLEPRDAFFGGRTNAATLHAEVDEAKGEEIRYVDVTSLYPTVNKYDEYPIGHPTIITQPDDQDITHYFGLAKVDVLAPRGLYHPVLPHRSGDKLTFPLCRACVSEEMAKPLLQRSYQCPHEEVERVFRGTWCTPELLQAVEEGYVIRRIHEVWHFPPNQRRRGLFAEYVNTWLRLKQESSGYPSWAQTPSTEIRVYPTVSTTGRYLPRPCNR